MPHHSRLIPTLFATDLPAARLAAWVLDFVRREDLFHPGDRVLVAVSGGPDSVALLHLLAGWRRELGLELAVGHFDHGLRGRESREDAVFVAELAQSLQLPCHQGRGDVKELARARKISRQMAARQLRLDFLKDTCRTQCYGKLALGHTADDQVELFFLRLLRGAGPEGLKGMWPATPEGLVRPLLSVGKAPLLAWLQSQGLPYRRDESNLSRKYLRNRVRLDLTRLLRLEPGWQLRLLRAAVGKISGEAALTAAQTTALLDLALGEKSGGLISVGETRVARAGPELHLFRRLPAPAAGVTLLPAPPGRLESPEGWSWTWSGRARPAGGLLPIEPHVAVLDGERLTFPLEVRYFRAGDRFWPLGAPGPKKLQDFLVDAKIPRWLRPHIPVVVSGGQLVWVAGLRPAETVKVTEASRTLLTLEIRPARPETRRIWEMILACRGQGR